MKRFLILAVVIAIAGCTSQNSLANIYNTFDVQISVNPQSAYTGTDVSVKASVENYGNKTYYDVYVDMFDDGALETHGACNPLFFDSFGRVDKLPRLEPKQIVNLYPCVFTLPSYIDQDKLDTTLKFRTGFSTLIETTQLIPVISQRLKERGNYKVYPQTYESQDGNIQITITFNQKLPLVARRKESCSVENAPYSTRENCRYFMYVTIKNIGNGFVSDLKGNDIRFVEYPAGIIKSCDYSPNDNFVLQRNEFKKITCELNPDMFVETPTYSGTANYIYNLNIVTSIYYSYELRKEIPITVLR